MHGLHAAEMELCLEEVLPWLKDQGLRSAVIVTGTGHHSSGPQKAAVLLPAVGEYLERAGYTHALVKDNKDYVGGYKVSLM